MLAYALHQSPLMHIPSRAQRRIVAGLHGITLILLGLHLYVRSLPPTLTPLPDPNSAEAAWWGFWPVTYAPTWTVVLGTMIVLGAIGLFWLREPRNQTSRPEAAYERRPHFLWWLGLSLCLLVAFFRFPIVHTRWGDAFLIAKAIAWPDPTQRLTYSWQAPLDVFLHSQVWLRGHEALRWKNAISVYRLLSPLAGGLYLLAVLWLVAAEELAPGWLTFGLLTTLGLLQLFFGYIENYSFMAAGVLLYLWLGLAALAGKKPLWLAATVLAVTHATHPSTIILAPSLLYCGWQLTKNSPKRNQLRYANVLQIALPMLMVAAATLLLMTVGGHGLSALFTTDRPGGSDASFFVPLWTISSQWQHYTIFSWLHLRDFLNEQILVAPVVLPSLLWLIGVTYGGLLIHQWGRDKSSSTHAETHLSLITDHSANIVNFLAIATLFYLLFVWVWNPDYGGQRDWDLFSPVALPAALWLLTLLPRVLPTRRYLLAGTIPLIMVQCLHTAAWIYQNTLPWRWPK